MHASSFGFGLRQVRLVGTLGSGSTRGLDLKGLQVCLVTTYRLHAGMCARGLSRTRVSGGRASVRWKGLLLWMDYNSASTYNQNGDTILLHSLYVEGVSGTYHKTFCSVRSDGCGLRREKQ